MTDAAEGQVAGSAAQIYEDFFVPALFGAWAPRVAGAAGIGLGDSVLDVACGTGVLARAARQLAGPEARIAGLDRNEGMLAVARQADPGIEWIEGRAEALPFADASFQRAVSQFGLMFFEDRTAALREMRRVVAPGGRIAVAVWAALDQAPGYAAMVALLRRLFDERRAETLTAPYVLGDEAALVDLFAGAGFADVDIRFTGGEAHFTSIRAWVETDVRGWTLGPLIDEDEFALLLREAEKDLAPFRASDGSVRFAHPALIVTATR